jgi:hypothetical protein
MSTNKLENMQNVLTKSSSGINIDGLDVDSVLDNIIEKTSGYENMNTKEKNSFKKQYKESAKPFIEQKISLIKIFFKTIKDGIKQLLDNIKNMIAGNLIPPAISTTGSTPNPAWSIIETKQKINIMLSICAQLTNAFISLVETALMIKYELPNSVLNVYSDISNVQKNLEQI